MTTPTCTVSTITNNHSWICCEDSKTDDLAQCEQVSNVTNALATRITQLPCFSTTWYKRTTGGAISYYKNQDGYYYCEGGGTSATTGTGCPPIPLIETTKVTQNIKIVNTTNQTNNTLLCDKVTNPGYEIGPILEPLINFKVSIFKITGCNKKYYDFDFKKKTEFSIDAKEYNSRNFIKSGNYIETRDGTGYFSDDNYKGLVMSIPYNGIYIGTINMLTTLLSRQLIKAQCKCNDMDYNAMMLKIGSKIMQGYRNQLIKKLEKQYNLSFKNSVDRKSILIVIDYLNSENPFIKFIFANWYVSQNDGTLYCRKLAIKMVFVYKMVVKLLKEQNININDEIINIYMDLMWKTLICCKKISIKKINYAFKKFTTTDLFSKIYCLIFKKWFCFVDINNDIHELIQMEIAFDRMTTDELLNATDCPSSPNYYLTLNEPYINLIVIKDRMQLYIRLTIDIKNTPKSEDISEEQQKKIVKKSLKDRLIHRDY
jgi:hypothetical protein